MWNVRCGPQKFTFSFKTKITEFWPECQTLSDIKVELVSQPCINYISIKVEDRLPSREACLVNHDAYSQFSDSDPKKCGLALGTALFHARASWHYLNAFQQPFNTK